MLKILLECFTLFIILLYSVLSTFYLISQLLLNLAFLVFIIPNSPSSRLLLDVWNFILGIAITLGHYYFILICMTATRKLTKLSDKLFKHTLPGYLKIKSFSKNARIISLFVHFIQIVYMMQILKSYWDPKQKSISSGNNKSGNNQSELTEEYDQISKYIIGCLIWINVGQFVNQVLVTFNGMILMAFYLAFQTLGCCGPEDTYDEIDETNESQPEDIFQFLETRIEELKFKYKNLQRRFAKKNKTISKMCIICFEEFHADTEVIQLQCNQNHIYHQKCLLEWLEKNKSCPLCRKEITHSLPRKRQQNTQASSMDVSDLEMQRQSSQDEEAQLYQQQLQS